MLASPFAVVCGMVYNFLPFTMLPLYTSLEKIDPRLHEAGRDLYCSALPDLALRHLPLSLPGVIARHPADLHPGRRRLHQRPMLGSPNTR